MKETIFTEKGAKPIAPYSPGTSANGFVFVSGQIGIDPATGKLAEGIEAQTTQALKNLLAVLEAAGLGAEDVVKTTVFLANIDDFSAMNGAYGKFFPNNCPARSAFQIACLPGKEALVEIEAIAAK